MTEQLWNADAIAHYLASTDANVALMVSSGFGYMMEVIGTMASIERLAIEGRDFACLKRA